MSGDEAVIVAEVVRSGVVESTHRGRLVVLDRDGRVDVALGDVDSPMYPRSASKPGQVTAMVHHGLPLTGELLALSASSHSGEDFHLAGVRRILAQFGLGESALQNTPGYPLTANEMREYVRRGFGESSIAADCSGKHAAMLATCVVNGWSTADYLEPSHPLQLAIHDTLEELANEAVVTTSIDGCGAPLFALSLTGVARMMRSITLAGPDRAGHRVAAAIRNHPEWTSGSVRDEMRLVRAIPGLVAKAGAEAVYVVGLADGRAVALKIDDGGTRARRVVMSATLQRLGLDHPVLDDIEYVPVLGGGKEVGAIRPTLTF